MKKYTLRLLSSCSLILTPRLTCWIGFVSLLSCLSTYAQGTNSWFNSSYSFESSIEDASGSWQPTLGGTQAYVAANNSQALDMVGQTYLEFPIEMSQAIDTNESFYLSVDFMLPPEDGIDESYRFIAANKSWAYDEPGFRIVAYNEKTGNKQQDTVDIIFSIGIGDGEISKRFTDVKMGEWQNASIHVDFTNQAVTFNLTGRTYEQPLTEYSWGGPADPSRFIQSMNENAIRIGAPGPSPAYPEDPPWINWHQVTNNNDNTTLHPARIQIDNLQISAPRPPGDPLKVIDALERFTAHLQGTNILDDATAETLLDQLRSNIIGVELADIQPAVRTFLNEHGARIGPLYTADGNVSRYIDFSPVSKAYVDLGVWILEAGLNADNAHLLEGLTLIEHELFPGELSPGAERVTNGVANIRAQYVPDPWYRMGGMQINPNNELSSYLYRPTGFYAPAGELVTVTVDPALVDSGLYIRVGAHKENHILLSQTGRFPLISKDYRIESTSFQVINPFGGSIQVLVPEGTDLGWVDIRFDGAVREPYYSARAGRETTLAEWDTIRQYPGLFANLESDKYVITVRASALRNFDQPDILMQKWDQIMDIEQVIHGRPLERSRAEGFLADISTAVVGSAPGGYPVTPGLFAEGPTDITDGYYSPFAVLDVNRLTVRNDFNVMLHEMSHYHLGRYIEVGGQESFVNLPMAAVLNIMYGFSFDDALKYSLKQHLTRTDAAIDWMLSYNFRHGNPIGRDPTSFLETAYQARGHAKYVDLADIGGGWEAVGDVYKVFYDEDKASGIPATYTHQIGVSHDEILLKGSQGLGYNLASLFHFWGIHPSEAVAAQLAAYPNLPGASDRILHYLEAAPRTNEELRQFHAEKTQDDPNQLKSAVYEPLMEVFDESYGQQIRDQGAYILTKYFGITPDAPPTTPQPTTVAFDLNTNTNSVVTFSWTPSVDPEGRELNYSWKLYDRDTSEVLLSSNWVSATHIDFTVGELTAALGSRMETNTLSQLAQRVTTSDPFTIISSDELVSDFYNGRAALPGNDADGDGCSDRDEWFIGSDYLDSSSVFKAFVQPSGTNGFLLSWPVFRTGLQYELLGTTNLVTGPWSSLGSTASSNILYSTTNASMFYRIDATEGH